MRIIFPLSLSLSLLLLSACGSGLVTEQSVARCKSTLSYNADIAQILDNANCAACHKTKYEGIANIDANRARIFQQIDSRNMPPSNTKFGQSADRDLLLSWLSCETLK